MKRFPPTDRAVAFGILMDPIANIKIKKDSSFAMLLEAQRRGYALWYMEPGDLYLSNGEARATQRALSVRDDPAGWFSFGETRDCALHELDLLFMRKDPPFDLDYIVLTWLLDLAERAGVRVINPPAALRNFNEKMTISLFPELCVPTLVSADAAALRAFLADQEQIVVKPIDNMGGASIFRITQGDANTNVILETITGGGRKIVMAQRFVPDVTQGDKRILLIDGEAVPYALARIPQAGDFRANLAVGGRGVGQPLSTRDQEIAQQVGVHLRAHGIRFAGIDVIGDYLTEINITSPTCIRELDAQFNLNISALLFDAIENNP